MSESSTPTKEALNLADRMIGENGTRLFAHNADGDGRGAWLDRDEIAVLIDEATNLPALLESHKQLVENFSRLYLELCELEIPHHAASPFSIGWNAAILGARAVSSRWLAKAKEITG